MVITSGISPTGKGINRSFRFSYKTKLPAHVDKMWTNQAQIRSGSLFYRLLFYALVKKTVSNKPKTECTASGWVGRMFWMRTVSTETRESERGRQEGGGLKGERRGGGNDTVMTEGPAGRLTYLQNGWLIPCMK